MGDVPKQVDIWHREIHGTEWLRGNDSLRTMARFCLAGILVAAGAFDFFVAVNGIRSGWFASTAKWMEVGPWFKYAISLQAVVAGVVALACARLFLKTRELAYFMLGSIWATGGIFLGPSHAPTEPGITTIFWVRYGLTIVMIGLAIAQFGVIKLRKPSR